MSDLVIIANRLPIAVSEDGGRRRWTRSPGGLVAALWPDLRARGGTWIGWPGATGDVAIPGELDGVALSPITLSGDDYEAYYEGFSNATIWPLYHDAIRQPVFDPGWWAPYRRINERFAQAAAETAGAGATVWVQDYHLQLVPQFLRSLRPDLRIAFFLHIPFPPPELFRQLPWRKELIEGLLGADLVGFQTKPDVDNFVRAARGLSDATGRVPLMRYGDRRVAVNAFPVAIDHRAYQQLATDPAVIQRSRDIREELGDPLKVLLGVDRLDYTKGIDLRLSAVGELYHDGALTLPDHVVLQVAVPTRGEVAAYVELRESVERLVGTINGEVSTIGHSAIHYIHRSVPMDELVALYLAADVLLVTPLRDGMNLVAKEYVATRLDDTGALVLSEFAGAAHELRGAYQVNPHDIESLKRAVAAAVRGQRQRSRMRQMRRVVLSRDASDWASDLLAALPERTS